MDGVADVTTLQIKKLFQTVLSGRRGRQADNSSDRARLEKRFKSDCWHVMALINDHQTVSPEESGMIVDARQAGQHCDIEFSRQSPRCSPPCSDLFSFFDAKKPDRLLAPLIEEERTVFRSSNALQNVQTFSVALTFCTAYSCLVPHGDDLAAACTTTSGLKSRWTGWRGVAKSRTW
jgi:hypothetical protein